jgi:hypothetical protein
MSFVSVSSRAVAVRYLLKGPADHRTDTLVATLVNAGAGIEVVTPGTAYRVSSGRANLAPLIESLAKCEGYSLDVEPAPTDVTILGSTVAPARAYRRTFTVHGANAATFSAVARAVDRRLVVTPVGVNRWAVTASTSDLIQWAAVVHGKAASEVMKLHGITPAMVKAEDEPVHPISVVSLPARQTVTEVSRDHVGDIRETIQRESDL